MSSLSSKFSTFVVPSLRAARSKQRLLRDFDPGRVMVPSSDFIGFRVRVFSSLFSIDVGDDVVAVWDNFVLWMFGMKDGEVKEEDMFMFVRKRRRKALDVFVILFLALMRIDLL